MDLQNIVDQAKTFVTATVDEAKAALNRNEPKEAKRLLTQCQRELRDLKRKVADEERDVRAQFQEARLKIDRSGQVIGTFGGSKARGILAQGRAAEKRNLAARKAATADAYRRVKSIIDDFLAQVDNMKYKIDSAMSQAREQGAAQTPDAQGGSAPTPTRSATTPTVPPPPPPTPASWKADPFGRHELRYWNGAEWTEQLADAGLQSTDQPD